jgi:hypothetical protein
VRFTRSGAQVSAELDEVEAQILAHLAEQLLELVTPAEVSDDPLAAMVGMPPGEVHPPDEPVLWRLLPDAYRQDPAAAGDFRRYTDHDLRSGKRANAKTLLASLPEGGGSLILDRDQVDAWLSSLNDLRLALGTALGVTEDGSDETDDPEDLDDPEDASTGIYHWLGYLQESLLSCVEPRQS